MAYFGFVPCQSRVGGLLEFCDMHGFCGTFFICGMEPTIYLKAANASEKSIIPTHHPRSLSVLES